MRNTDTSNIHLLESAIVYGAPGKAITVQPNRPVTWLLVSVCQGGVDIYIGATAGGLVPHYHFGQTNKPEWVPVPTGQYCFTLVAVGPPTTVTAMVHFLGPPA